LLTLAEGSLYYNTNLGSVAKLSTHDGALQWVAQYPRGAFPNTDPDRRDRHFFRDLTPCLFYQGMVLCAPSDTDRIFALDAGTGQLVWSTDVEIASDAAHLLGVQGKHLVASGDYLYWFDVFTGQMAGQYPPPQKDAPGYTLPSPTGYGRGLIASGEVYWPTWQRIEVFAEPTGGVVPLCLSRCGASRRARRFRAAGICSWRGKRSLLPARRRWRRSGIRLGRGRNNTARRSRNQSQEANTEARRTQIWKNAECEMRNGPGEAS
jgi:hypothetical protein